MLRSSSRVLRTLLVSILVLAGPGLPGLSAQDTTFSLDGLVVTAAPLPIAEEGVSSHLTVLSGSELRARGLTTVADALRGGAGLDVVRGGSFGAVTSLFLRGGESDYVLVLIDGVQVNQPGGAFDFAGLSLANVDRIEVLRGPASALYGSDAVSGVIHIVTRTGGPETGATLRSRMGGSGRRDWSVSARGGSDRAAYAIGIERQATEGVYDFNNRHTNSVLTGSARFLPDDRTRADITLRVGDRKYHTPTDGSGAAVDRNAFTYGDEVALGARLRRDLTSRLSLEAKVGVADLDGGQDDAPDGPADTLGFYGFTSLDHFRRANADLRGHLVLGGADVTAGFEFEEERQRSFTESASAFGTSYGRSRNARTNHAAYGHLSGAAGRLSYMAGARVDDNERFGTFTTWQGGATVALDPESRSRLRLSAGRGLKEPTFFENYATGFATGNPDLSPERSTSWEVGLDRALWSDRLELRLTAFAQRFEDLIQYTFSPPNPADPNFFNVAEARSRGVEVDLTAAVGRFDARAAWTWLDSEVLDSGFDSGEGATFVAGEALLRRPASRGSLGLSARLSGSALIHGEVVHVGERSDRDFSAFPAAPVTLASYTLVGIGADLTVVDREEGRPGVAMEFRLDNAFDAEYEEVFGFRTPGRLLYVGVRVDFGGG